MLADVGMVKMYSKSAHVNDLGFVWTGPPPCCMDQLPPPPPPPLCMDRPSIGVHGKKFNGMPLGKLHLLAAACIPMAAVQVLTGCNLRWWSFSSAIERIYFLAHVVVRMVLVPL